MTSLNKALDTTSRHQMLSTRPRRERSVLSAELYRRSPHRSCSSDKFRSVTCGCGVRLLQDVLRLTHLCALTERTPIDLTHTLLVLVISGVARVLFRTLERRLFQQPFWKLSRFRLFCTSSLVTSYCLCQLHALELNVEAVCRVWHLISDCDHLLGRISQPH